MIIQHGNLNKMMIVELENYLDLMQNNGVLFIYCCTFESNNNPSH